MPPLTAWVFYAVNLLVVAGYVVSVAMLLRPSGLTGNGRMPWPSLTAALVFFGCCTAIHAELAIHAYTGTPIVNRDGTVAWHFLAIVTIKVAAIFAFLLHTYATREAVPLSSHPDPDRPDPPIPAAAAAGGDPPT